MCLSIVDTNHPELKIASQDIPCYKIMVNEGWRKYILFGPRPIVTVFRREPYVIDQIKKSRLVLDIPGQEFVIVPEVNVGLHSYADANDALRKAARFYPADIYEFIIPAGASYYEGEQNFVAGYASDTLIMKRKLSIKDIWNLTRLKMLKDIHKSLSKISSKVTE